MRPSSTTAGRARILDVLLAHGVPLEHACGGSCACTTCHVVVKRGLDQLSEAEESEEDLLDKAPGLTPTSRLGCQAVIEDDDAVIEVPSRATPSTRSRAAMAEERTAVLEAVRDHGGETRSLFLRVPGGLAFRPGQFVSCLLPVGGERLIRPYSIASSPEDPERLELLIDRVPGGPGSHYLFDLSPGARSASPARGVPSCWIALPKPRPSSSPSVRASPPSVRCCTGPRRVPRIR